MIMPQGVYDLVPILRLRQLLNTALAPVRPREEFRIRLREQLLEEARRAPSAGADRGWLQREWSSISGRREILIGAAIGSAVSLAGIIALIIRWRLSGKSMEQPAA